MKRPTSTIGLQNVAYVEEMFARWQAQPGSVPEEWQRHFVEGFGEGNNGSLKLGPSFPSRSLFNPAGTDSRSRVEEWPEVELRGAGVQDRLNQLIRNFRTRGHTIAAIEPLGTPRRAPAELDLGYYAFTEAELNLVTNCAALPYDTPLSIREIIERLRDTYCRSIGVEYMHIDDLAVRRWLQRRMESSRNRLQLSHDEQERIFTRLTDAVVFEEFLRKKFIGAKTFSLEGSESLIPLLDLALERAGEQGVAEVVFGLAHRGRLNVLANIIGKSSRQIFREFADADPGLWLGRGDVKYHLGHSGKWTTAAGHKLHLSLCFNPSHLEFVNPVALGRVRAKQDRLGDNQRRAVLGVLIHGDAAMAGEGVVQETLNLSRLPGYRVGGTLHVVVNNQIGFTTTPQEGRSTPYATDVARMLQVPIFHVNGENPEAVAQVVRLALDFRHEFQQDVVIDMYGYRRWGHNETDEPSFTQPVLYHAIKNRKPVREGYLEHLLKLGSVTAEEAEAIATARRTALETELNSARGSGGKSGPEDAHLWKNYTGGPEPVEEPKTIVKKEQLVLLLRKSVEVPKRFHPHPKLARLFEARRAMADEKEPLDWSAGEALALASLATEGVRIRLSGQDSGRGTFSHRHAILYDTGDGSPYAPLQHLTPRQAPVEILNSPLSEAGVLGFDYGYSLDCPGGLILWEAQFGDFVNAAQVILDQFISSAEDKWGRLSGITLLLPHGFEGMGPEHSSARLERFLTLAAEDNLQIAQPTTPAQLFHLLRRQALNRWRKPLVVLTPKSLLRHSQVVSPLEQLAQGSFERVLPDTTTAAAQVRHLLLCTGKVYYDLVAHRAERRREDVAIVRLEQLYPLRLEPLERVLKPYADGTPISWVQEEPANMGAWRYLHQRFGTNLAGRFPLDFVSRPESASPATGSASAHKLEQAQLLARAFGEPQPKSAAETTATTSPEIPPAASATQEKN